MGRPLRRHGLHPQQIVRAGDIEEQQARLAGRDHRHAVDNRQVDRLAPGKFRVADRHRVKHVADIQRGDTAQVATVPKHKGVMRPDRQRLRRSTRIVEKGLLLLRIERRLVIAHLIRFSGSGRHIEQVERPPFVERGEAIEHTAGVRGIYGV